MIVEVARDEGGDPQFVAATFIPIGLTSIGIGTYLLVRGAKARANFNEWRAFTRADSRPTGEGLLVAGTMSTVIGCVSLLAASIQAREPDAFLGQRTESCERQQNENRWQPDDRN